MNNLLFSVAQISDNLTNTLSDSLGVWYLLLFNFFGVVAVILKVTEFQQKNRKTIFALATSSTFCWTLYFTLQGDFLSAAINLICAVQMFVFMQKGKRKWADSIWWMVFFLGIQFFLGVFTFKNWHDIFALFGGMLTTLVYFVMDQKKYRRLAFISLICWVLNGAFKDYIIALINDAGGAISALVGIIRFDFLGKNKKETQNNE